MKRSRSLVLITAIGALLVLFAIPASAQSMNIDLGDPEGSLTDRVLQLIALISILSLAPSILIMVTSFIRIVVVLSLLRMAMGVQSSPPNSVIISLALFLTAFIMAPTFKVAYENGIEPYMNGEVELTTAYDHASGPIKQFMLKQVREDDLSLFINMAQVDVPETPEDIQIHVLIPSFMISELRRAFEIGFLIFIPFLVIDMVVASVLMSMGMMMLPPIIISLPFKLIFFVLVDGWHLIAGSLVKSFGTLPPGG